jgi:hypothetical protein
VHAGALGRGGIVTDSPLAVNLALDQASASFRRHLRAANKAPRTVQTHLDALDHFGRYLRAVDAPLNVGLIQTTHVEAGWSSSRTTVAARPRSPTAIARYSSSSAGWPTRRRLSAPPWTA